MYADNFVVSFDLINSREIGKGRKKWFGLDDQVCYILSVNAPSDLDEPSESSSEPAS